MKKIAVIQDYFQWGGGKHFLNLLLFSLHYLPNDPIQVIVFRRKYTLSYLIKNVLLNPATLRNVVLVPDILIPLVKDIIFWKKSTKKKNKRSRFAMVEYTSLDDLQKKAIVLSVMCYLYVPAGVPLVSQSRLPFFGYLFDFQHKDKPELFSDEDYEHRDHAHEELLQNAQNVLVNSQHTRKQAKKHHPKQADRVISLPFAPILEPDFLTYSVKWNELQRKYSLPKKYFIVSNQFWQHKDHPTAFRAFAEFLRVTKSKDIHLICTGARFDSRNRGYMQELQDLIESLGVQSSIQFLGFLPRNEQLRILQHSLAVVQPTTYEGGPGAGSGYDAVSLGVPLIVSDLDINKELRGKHIYFFKTGNAHDLAQKMMELLQKKPVKPLSLSQMIAQSKKYSKDYLTILNRAIDGMPSRVS